MSDRRSALERQIRATFAGIVLGDGVSLTQAAYRDRRGDMPAELVRQLSDSDIVDDWSSLTVADLDRDNIAHLDAEGFRYYLPALMLSVISHYDAGSMRVIGTLGALRPSPISPYDRSNLLHQYALLDEAQKRSIARFLRVLPELVELESDDRKVAERALERYWKAFLVEEPPGG